MAKKTSRRTPPKRERGIVLDGNTLRLHRRARSAMTQDDFAHFAKIPVRSLQRAEAEEPVDAFTHERIAAACGVSPIALVKVDDNALTPSAQARNKVRKYVDGYVDLEPEIAAMLENNSAATKFYLCLYARSLIEDGALSIHFRTGSIIYTASLTVRDIQRVVTAFANGRLAGLNVVALKLRDDPPGAAFLLPKGAVIHRPVELSHEVRAALDRIAERIAPIRMQAFNYSVINRMPIDRVAKALGLSPAAVLNSQRRIMILLKRELAPQEHSDEALAAALREP